MTQESTDLVALQTWLLESSHHEIIMTNMWSPSTELGKEHVAAAHSRTTFDHAATLGPS
jgi:hypothetical protein